MNKKWTSLATLLAAASLTTLSSVSHAYTFTETGDTGDTLETAEDATMGTGSLTAIYGTIGQAGMDADVYEISIASPATFSATTNNTLTNTAFNGGQPLDTALFLFDSSGDAIATNDDTSGSIVTSTLPAGNSLYATLPAGIYYIGISISGNEPVNSVNQLLFATSNDSTAIRGPEGSNNTNPTTLSSFDADNYDNETGSYEIDFAAMATVPEPSTWALSALGALAVGYVSLRRKAGQV